MRRIDELNEQYIKLKQYKNTLRKCYSELLNIKNNSYSNLSQKIESMRQVLINTYQNSNKLASGLLHDVITVATYYNKYISSVNLYQQSMLKAASSQKYETEDLFSEVKKCKIGLNAIRDKFCRFYNKTINSEKNMVDLFIESVNLEFAKAEKDIISVKDDAAKYLNSKLQLTLSADEQYNKGDSLPQSFHVGNSITGNNTTELLIDLGYSISFQNVYLDLKSQGNLLINTSAENINDEAIDNYLIAYIFRYISSFPLGSVNVHIFDNNANYLYKRLDNSFKAENSSDSSKKTITIHTSLNDITSLSDSICDDIFKKTSVNTPDLYSIYETDSSDAFHLVIIRNGLGNTSVSGGMSVLNTLSRLSKANDTGHICGFRFVLVDDSQSFEKSNTKSTMAAIGRVKENFSIKIQYDGHRFLLDDKPFDPLCINDNTDRFIQERGSLLSAAISGKEQSYISINDTLAKEISSFNESILYIPIGKSGNSVVEIPLSCRDDNGTLEGQCIGYMAIGRSGSGKSSFFHSVVLNGCLRYSPNDLQFWLLDFKFGGASSKYNRSGLPHIKIVAENNKIDDALCLFQNILGEMERRNACFNRFNVDNIIDYNNLAKADDSMEHFPRIIVLIDEIQEIFRDENAAQIKNLISSISVRMRSSGIHFIMIAQNLVDGKSYMLKESFLQHATGRICFRVEEKVPFESGFGDLFNQRKTEIAKLKTGEAYLSYGNDNIKKVKVAFASPEEMEKNYFVKIREKYSAYAALKPLIIGSKARLKITDKLQNSNMTYIEKNRSIKSVNNCYHAVVGEDGYGLTPLSIGFNRNSNSSVLLLGDDKLIASSLCTSVALSLIKQDISVHLFNGDKSKVQSGDDVFPHAFMYLCSKLACLDSKVKYHKSNQLPSVLNDLYNLYAERENMAQQFEDEDYSFEAEFVVINDAAGIKAIMDNEIVNRAESKSDHLLSSRLRSSSGSRANDDVSTQTVLDTLLKNGYRFNIHLIMAVRGDPSELKYLRNLSVAKNIFLFNNCDSTSGFGDTYFIKEMLKNISNNGDQETMAVYSQNRRLSKIRPVIYNLNNAEEKRMIDDLIAEV